MPRFRFRLATMAWLTLALACFFAGQRFEQAKAERLIIIKMIDESGNIVGQTMRRIPNR